MTSQDAASRNIVISICRSIVVAAGTATGLLLMTRIIPGLTVSNYETALLAVIAISLLNAILWPILSYMTLPFLVFSFGIGTVVLNAVIFYLAGSFVEGFHVQGFWALLLTPIGLSIINTAISFMLTIDDDAAYCRSVLKKAALPQRRGSDESTNGIVFLEIDGLSLSALNRCLKSGDMPALKGLIDAGSHRLIGWETDLSSQTGACQAGILHGCNRDMPAFRWLEKENGNKLISSTGPLDAPLIERRISNKQGLLASNGASRSNLFSGDAPSVMFTYSQITNMSRFYNDAWYFFYSGPYNFPHTIALFLWDVLRELRSRYIQWRLDVRPRLTHIGTYPILRAFANVFLREMTTFTLIGDIARGKHDAIYSTYVAYDEIAHHSGVLDRESIYSLRKLDRHFKWLMTAAIYSPRKYSFVFLSDHGQSNGSTFLQRYGLSLEDLVRSLLPGGTTIYSKLDTNQDHFGQALEHPVEKGSEILRDRLHVTLKTKIDDEAISLRDASVVVLASGNLGLIYFTKWKDHLSLERLEASFPGLIRGLVSHEGIGFIMVRSDELGYVVIGRSGTHQLETGIVHGEDPLSSFGENAAAHLRRTSGFRYLPDILVNGSYYRETDEVAAFEELVGSHGGLGGEQSRPFLMYPVECKVDERPIVGAEQVHQILKGLVKGSQTPQREDRT